MRQLLQWCLRPDPAQRPSYATIIGALDHLTNVWEHDFNVHGYALCGSDLAASLQEAADAADAAPVPAPAQHG